MSTDKPPIFLDPAGPLPIRRASSGVYTPPTFAHPPRKSSAPVLSVPPPPPPSLFSRSRSYLATISPGAYLTASPKPKGSISPTGVYTPSSFTEPRAEGSSPNKEFPLLSPRVFTGSPFPSPTGGEAAFPSPSTGRPRSLVIARKPPPDLSAARSPPKPVVEPRPQANKEMRTLEVDQPSDEMVVKRVW